MKKYERVLRDRTILRALLKGQPVDKREVDAYVKREVDKHMRKQARELPPGWGLTRAEWEQSVRRCAQPLAKVFADYRKNGPVGAGPLKESDAEEYAECRPSECFEHSED